MALSPAWLTVVPAPVGLLEETNGDATMCSQTSAKARVKALFTIPGRIG